jgi:pimeloyl-ACP methyl ester carboxylesterase
MSQTVHRFVEANGLRMHVAEQGAGPVVLLCHGFPELWYSWRHQLPALAAAGYRAVAPDMRGYGQTDRPDAVEQYTQLHLVGDMVGLLDALGEDTAVIAGHDWGAPVAWNATLMRPDRFRAVIALSVPYVPRGDTVPTVALRRAAGETFMYMLYFQEPGVAEAELEQDVRATMRRILHAASGEGQGFGVKPSTAKFLDGMVDPDTLPRWLTGADLDVYVGEFTRTGFRGGLNWYRNLDRSWELLAAYRGATIPRPALFIAGDRDLVIARRRTALEGMPNTVPRLDRSVLLPGCGHWTQQERPAEVNAEMIRFLAGLDREAAR